MTIDSTSTIPDWLDDVSWNDDGLVAAIAQEHASGDVLMLAWMNREALAETLARGEAVYWSRSRNQLWHKGDTSGHFQKVHDVRLDCDGDAVLLKVEQVGRIACHTGRHSCFYRQLDGRPDAARWVEVGTPLDHVHAEPT
jgi:phosphoribosyl-AMP cyclohydrolase